MLTEDLNMKHVSAKFVPRLLTEDQENSRLNVCYNLREQVGNPSSYLFTRSCTIRLFPVPSYERPDEKETFC